MVMAYKVKVKKISVANEAGDRVVIIHCYLMDSSGTPFKSIDGGDIGFDVRVPKSAPVPNPVPTVYLPNLAKAQIAIKYNRYLTVTSTPTHGGNKLLFSSNNVDKLFTGLTVTGAGLATPATLSSITGPTEIQLSANLNLQVTGGTTAPSLTYTGTTVLDSTTISSMSGTTNIASGMVITGTGIPYGTTVLSVVSSSSITITQKATVSGTATFTFSTNPESAYLNATTPYFTSTVYEGLMISGTSIPRDTTINEVITTSKISLSNNATGSSSSQVYSISGSPIYYFDTANLTLDTSELTAISQLPIINFANL